MHIIKLSLVAAETLIYNILSFPVHNGWEFLLAISRWNPSLGLYDAVGHQVLAVVPAHGPVQLDRRERGYMGAQTVEGRCTSRENNSLFIIVVLFMYGKIYLIFFYKIC